MINSLHVHFATEAMRSLIEASNSNKRDPYAAELTPERIAMEAWDLADAMMKKMPAEFGADDREFRRVKSELRSEKIAHTKTIDMLHGLQRQLEAHKAHCLSAHDCCWGPEVEP